MKRTLTTIIAVCILAGGILIGLNIGGIDMADRATAQSLTEAVSAKITRIFTAPEGAPLATAEKIYVYYSDGSSYEFGSFEDIMNWASEMQTPDNAQRLAVAYWLARNPSNPNIIVGKTLTLDLSAAAPIKVQ